MSLERHFDAVRLNYVHVVYLGHRVALSLVLKVSS